MIQINPFQVRQPVRLQGEHHRQPQEDHGHHVRREAGEIEEDCLKAFSCKVPALLCYGAWGKLGQVPQTFSIGLGRHLEGSEVQVLSVTVPIKCKMNFLA